MTIGSRGGLQPCPAWLAAAEAIVFDKDGTLIDLSARWAPFFTSAFTVVVDGDTWLMKQFEEALGVAGGRLIPNGPAAISTPAEIMKRAHDVLEQAGWSIDRRNDSLAVGIAAAEMGALIPIGHVAGAMSELVRCGVKVAIATSDGRDNTRDEIAELGIEEHVSALACGDDDVVKPNPEVLLRLGNALQVAPDRMVYVGDSEQDRLTADAANIRFVEVRAVGDVGIGSDYWVHSIGEIADTVAAQKRG